MRVLRAVPVIRRRCVGVVLVYALAATGLGGRHDD